MIPSSSKPYILRALYEWAYDQSMTPHLVVEVDKHCVVPKAFVRDGYITFNVGPMATKDFMIDDHWVSFSARFGGQAQDVLFPVATVASFFVRETQEGMGFLVEKDYDLPQDETGPSLTTASSSSSKRASLTLATQGSGAKSESEQAHTEAASKSSADETAEQSPKKTAKVLSLFK